MRTRRERLQSAVTSVTWPSSTCQRRVSRTVSSMRRSCVTSRIVPVERVERGLQLLDRRQVEVVGRLVEDQQVDAARLQEREGGAGPLAGRLRRRRPVDVVAARARTWPAACARRRWSSPGPRGRTRRPAARRPRTRARAWSTSPTSTPEPEVDRARRRAQPAEQQREQRRLARPVRPGDGDAVLPVELQVDRPEREVAARHHGVPRRRDHGPRAARRRRSSSAAATPCAAPRRPRAGRSSCRSAAPWRPASPTSRRGSA